MKRIDAYILRSFITIFMKTLAISVFFLLMQMVWKYIDDLAGRGVGYLSILELIAYWAVVILPMAVPVATLFAGIMTYGNLAESNEMAAAKSGGASFYRLLRPAIGILAIIAIGMFYVSNNLIPVANFKGENLLLNIAKQKPTFNLKPGIFYNGIEGYSIKVASKEDNRLEDLMIYDHRERGQGARLVITAPEGYLNYQEGSRWMELELLNGFSYEPQESKDPEMKTRDPYVATSFERMQLRFNMSGFQLTNLYSVNRSDEYNMLNISQLASAMEKLDSNMGYRMSEVASIIHHKYFGWEHALDDTMAFHSSAPFRVQSRIQGAYRYRSLNNAIQMAQSNKEYMRQVSEEITWRKRVIARHYLEWHKKFSIAFACVLLFFIGAPLGAIIQKGGFGLPFVISVLLFLLHYVLATVFEKMGRDWIIDPIWAIWGPNLILLPVALWMTIWAANDATLHSFQRLGQWFKWKSSKA